MFSISDIIDRIICGSDSKELTDYYIDKIAKSQSKFRCDYCENYYSVKEMHLSVETDTKYESSATRLGRPAINSTHNLYTVRLCSRCNKVHNIAGWLHFIIHVVCIVIALCLSWEENMTLEKVIFPVIIAVLIAQGIRFLDWFIIKQLFDVRRKPRKSYEKL